MSPRSHHSIPYGRIFAICLLSFTLGYFVRGLRDSPVAQSQTFQSAQAAIANSGESSVHTNDHSEYDTLLSTIDAAVDPDKWLESGGTSTIEPLPSNIVSCTAEDIFGSREAYRKMLEGSTGEAAAANGPFGSTAHDDPFDSAVDQ